MPSRQMQKSIFQPMAKAIRGINRFLELSNFRRQLADD
ncbi:hypothetical protein [Methylomonas fluvii]|nr:hypothetical protein [Methylomonas fluvii]